MICEPDEQKDEADGADAEEPKKGHGGCGHTQPQVRKEGLKPFVQYKKSKEDDEDGKSLQPDIRLITPSEVYTTFKKMTDSDLQIIWLSEEYARPEWMILTVMPVPPPPVRPSIAVDGGTMQSEDDLTYKLGDIIKASANVRRCEQEGAPAYVISEFEQLLQFHVATYMDNDIAGIPQVLQKSGRPVKAIHARLKGMEGRLPGNLMGKRVDFLGRTVIPRDPNLELDEVGVPKSIAMNLTFPERVTPFNISYLQELVRNGPTTYSGARYVIRDTGERIDLRYNKCADAFLQYGWIVERHLKDGDYILFNRQPSLHKMSMMSHRVKLMPYSTFRLNLSVTPSYNADFEGDEMNMQLSPQANKPVMGFVQDTLCGIRKLTLRDTFMDWNAVQNILLWVPDWDGIVPIPAIIKPKPMWMGKQILSLAIPRGINIFRAAEPKSSNPDFDDGMCTENGEIAWGIVEKKTVGASQGGLVHVIFREKDPEGARAVLWIAEGHAKTMAFITQTIASHKAEVAAITERATIDELKAAPGMTICESFESQVERQLNLALERDGVSIWAAWALEQGGITLLKRRQLAPSLLARPNGRDGFRVRVTEQATIDELKAAPGMTIRESFESQVKRQLNLARDTSGQYAQKNLKEDNNVKQMVVAGSKGSFINIFQMLDDFSPEARGFVENLYLRGLTPQEFFFNAIAGREGLIDTAVKTSKTAYIQRCLVKALEDVQVCYDGTVRNSLGDLIQFVYGEDGIDGAFIEKQNIATFGVNHAQFKHNYHVDVVDPAGGFLPGVLQVGVDDSSPKLQAKLDEEFAQLCEDRKLLREFVFPRAVPRSSHYLPVNLNRIVQNACQIFHIDRRKPSDLEPAYIVDAVRDLVKRLIVVRGDDALSREAQTNATLNFSMHLRATFASRKVLEQHHLTREAFDWVLGKVEAKFNQSIANPPSTPSLSVYLEPEISKNQYLAKNVQQELAYTTLRTVTAAVEIWYDLDPSSTIIEDDAVFVESFFAIPDEEISSKLHLQSPWLLRLELDRVKMIDRKLTMAYVAGRISECFKTDIFVIWSEDNAEKLIVRCRVLSTHDKEDVSEVEEDVFLRQLENTMLSSVSLRGVENINRVFLMEHDKVTAAEDSSIQANQEKEWVLETDDAKLKG
ncbi:DNA-directed RNA polymerase II subunit rpb1 [Pleurotus ostreatus]|uniref:DNA-directed RNA polymerase subunit n=1 Tax=Pleurotus ostreatus TaxID=5322 RepID=A0A8H6ZQ79_PLEOS|nr:DNA-directed RNA polymerase II subunit rpb1 [Pleurotus ostreatus]KAF7426815.1 DNA-directed RNA polymerase II subunit rpb1 [Pleurotus ostreatus]